MQPISAVEWTELVAVILAMATLIWLLPSCGEPTCVASHTQHVVGQRAIAIEKRHAAFHGESNPDPTCSLCQARKRDE